MELRVREENILNVDYGDFEEFVAEAYGKDSFQILESPNDTVHRFDISKPDSIYDDFEREQIEKWLLEEEFAVECYSLGYLLEDLARKDLIKRGIYLIDVCW